MNTTLQADLVLIRPYENKGKVRLFIDVDNGMLSSDISAIIGEPVFGKTCKVVISKFTDEPSPFYTTEQS